MKGRTVKPIEYVVDKNGCHICTSHASRNGRYFGIVRNGKHHMLHRFIFEQQNGTIPKGLVVRHKCDNTKCINLDHLELGTVGDNNRDTSRRGRCNVPCQIGEKNKNSRLTEKQVFEIKRDLVSTNMKLAEIYGVHHSTISAVRLGKTWSFIK